MRIHDKGRGLLDLRALSKLDAIDMIAARLSGRIWDADACDDVAALLRRAGYTVRELDGVAEAMDPPRVVARKIGARWQIVWQGSRVPVRCPELGINEDLTGYETKRGALEAARDINEWTPAPTEPAHPASVRA